MPNAHLGWGTLGPGSPNLPSPGAEKEALRGQMETEALSVRENGSPVRARADCSHFVLCVLIGGEKRAE